MVWKVAVVMMKTAYEKYQCNIFSVVLFVMRYSPIHNTLKKRENININGMNRPVFKLWLHCKLFLYKAFQGCVDTYNKMDVNSAF